MATDMPTNGHAESVSSHAEPGKEEIGWYFVERYYNTLSKNPENLYLLYNKKSQFVAGFEEEKVQVAIGLRGINERVKDLKYDNCKVRVTNVDSQASDTSIVVQVLGEMSNGPSGSGYHRKFVQTFVLAPQPSGYYLLNDILRWLRDEEDEDTLNDGSAAVEPVEEAAAPAPEPEEVEQPKAVVVDEESVQKVDEELEQVKAEQTPVNGTAAEAEAEAEEVDDAPAASAAAEAEIAEEEEEEKPVVDENPEKPVEPVHTPVPETKPAAKPAPAKPAVPLSWAQRLSANSARAQAASAASAATSSAPAQSKATPPTPSTAAPSAAAAPPASSTTTTAPPARQPSPSDSAQEGSTGGWQTAGGDHNRTKSRAGPATTDNGHVRAYVKNVFSNVKTEDLKAELSKYGELAYFDVSRQKNSAFVEYTTVAAFQAAVAANPHKIGGDNVFVEERRATQFGGNSRGGARGGRGGNFQGEGRSNSQRGGLGGKGGEGGARGGFQGRGRGGSGPGAGNRGGRPQQQAV